MSRIDWSSLAPAGRLLPHRPTKLPPPAKAPTRRSLHARIACHRAGIVDAFRNREIAIERGLDNCDPGLQPVVEAALANLRAPRPPFRLRHRVEGMVALLARAEEGAPVVPYWIACCGLPFAVAATCRWARLEYVEDDLSDEAVGWVALRSEPKFEPVPEMPSFRRGPWVQLREAVAMADPETYDAAKRMAWYLRVHARPAIRCVLAFVFSAETRWAFDDVQEELGNLPKDPYAPMPDHVLALLASLDRSWLVEDVIHAAIERGCGSLAGDYTWEIVARLGKDSIPSLELLEEENAVARVKEALAAKTVNAA